MQQLRYLRRNLGSIDKLLDLFEGQAFPLCGRDQKIYWGIQHIYAQQKEMYDQKKKRCDDRIVNIYQPYVRPIKRGKDKGETEFGAKPGVSEFDGFSRINHLSWDAYNESADLKMQVESYRALHGYYPEAVLADQIYLTRENRRYLKERGIRHIGVPLGRPKEETPKERKRWRKERGMRSHIEGKFGQGKNAYGLRENRARRQDTSEAWLGGIVLAMNLVNWEKIMRLLPALIILTGIVFVVYFFGWKTRCQAAGFGLFWTDRDRVWRSDESRQAHKYGRGAAAG